MANGPVFRASGDAAARRNDALDRVADLAREREMLAAQQAIALVEAHDEFFGVQSRSIQQAADRMLGERSFRAEVASLLTISERAAENLIGYSRVLCSSFPSTLEALKIGHLSWRHATIMVDELASLDAEPQAKLEAQLLKTAELLTPPKFARAARLARERLAPETIVERHTAAFETRGVELNDGRDGMSDLTMHLTSIQAHAIFGRATAAARGIDSPTDERTLDQRRADILAHILLAEVDGEMFGVVPDEFDDENFVRWFRGIKAEVVVSVPVLTLMGKSIEPGTLNGRVPIDPQTAKILAGSAKSFVRILTHPETGAVLSIGRRRYKTPKDLRRYLQIRDEICRFPGCSIAAQRSEVDHTHEWQFGGKTDSTNLGHLCTGHHTLKSSARWTVTQDAASVYTWTSETGRTYQTGPQGSLAS
jgi:Domain of unknown function (DUF222)